MVMMMRTKDLTNLTPAQRAELEAWGEEMASAVEADDSPVGEPMPEEELELRRAAFRRAYVVRAAEQEVRRAVAIAKAKGMSWEKVGHAIGTTGEAARQRYRETV